MIKPSGRIFYQDEYSQFYEVYWDTTNELLDITSVTSQPYIWGEERKGYVKNGILFRWGIITVERQIVRIVDGQYEIIADGSSQIFDYIQMNFPNGSGPSNSFAHYMYYIIRDDVQIKITNGSYWVGGGDIEKQTSGYFSPDYYESNYFSDYFLSSSDQSMVNWVPLQPDGSPADTTSTAFSWTDVWANTN